MKWSPLQRENRDLLSIFYLALQSVSSSCTFYFRNLIADTKVGTKVGTAGKQKALKSCDFKAFYWWGKVDSLFLRKKPRRLQRATGTLLRAAFRIHHPKCRYQKRDVIYDDVSFLVGEGGFEAWHFLPKIEIPLILQAFACVSCAWKHRISMSEIKSGYESGYGCGRDLRKIFWFIP